MRRERGLQGIVLALVLLLSLVWIMPILLAVTNSFKDYNDIIANFFSLPRGR